MLNNVDVDNALFVYDSLLKRLENPDATLKGVWYCNAKQQDFLLKLAQEAGALFNNQIERLDPLSERLRAWEDSGGVRVDEDGYLC